MPAKDNDPKAPKASAKSPAKATAKTPAKRRAVAKPDVTASAAVPEMPAKKIARPRRRVAAEASSPAPVPSLEAAAPVELQIEPTETAASLEVEVRLRAYLLYAERGFRGGSPESDWFQAEREVVYGRRA